MDILYTVLVVDKECHGPAETLCRLHCSNALHDLADEVDEGGVTLGKNWPTLSAVVCNLESAFIHPI